MAKGYLAEIDDIVGYIDLRREKERSNKLHSPNQGTNHILQGPA